MKTLCTLLVLLATLTPLQAQQVLFQQNFNNFPSYSITGWGRTFTGLVPWQVGESYLVAGACFEIPDKVDKLAVISDCGGFAPNNRNVLVYTPPIVVGATGGPLWLRYDSYFFAATSGGRQEQATVEISTDSAQSWTVVQTVQPNNVLGKMRRYYIDLSAFSTADTVHIGFRYSDDTASFYGWQVDNVSIFVPSPQDIALLDVSPSDTMKSYVKTGTGYTHQYTVLNAGLDTIHSFVMYHRLDNGPIYADVVNNANIPPFTVDTFMHSLPDTVNSIGTHQVTAWLQLAGDAHAYNDSARVSLRGAAFLPQKRVLVEEGSGTFSPWAPRGHVYMSQLAGDNKICGVQVHNTDPMEVEAYGDFLFYIGWNYVPYFLVDRVAIPPRNFFSRIDDWNERFAFAEIGITGGFQGNDLVVNAQVTPAIDLHADLRLALILTEDDVTGTGPGWDQANHYYSNNAQGLGPMGGYENLADTVPAADMHYNLVARAAVPGPEGQAGMLPRPLIANNAYTQLFTIPIDPSWDRTKLKAIVALINHDDSTVLNSNKIPFYLDVPRVNKPGELTAGLYPNPAGEAANVFFTLQTAEKVRMQVSDISGRVLWAMPERRAPQGYNVYSIPTAQLVPGIYLVTITAGDVRKTIKMQVLH